MISQLLLDLIPGGAKAFLFAAQAKELLAGIQPRDAAGKARLRVAAELVSDLERIYQRKKAADKELRDLLKATGTTLTTLHGIGPSAAARLLIEAGDITRFPSKAHFASWNGTAPIDASSGEQVRHRLSCEARIHDRGCDLLRLVGAWGCHAAIWYSCVSPLRTCLRRVRCSARLISGGRVPP